MNTTRILSLSTLALATAAALTACGGADTPLTGAQAFVSRITPAAPVSQRLRALASTGGGSTAAAAGVITNQQLVSWAQGQYASIFGAGTPAEFDIPYEGKNFHVWAFSTGAYLGVADGVIYGLGAFTGGQLASFGTVASYTCTVDPALCNEPPPPTGSLNECIDHAASSLPTGLRTNLVYVFSGLISGEQTVESVIDGPATFENQSAVQMTSITTGSNTIQGATTTTTTTIRSYQQTSTNGLVKTLGSLTDVTSATSIGGVIIPGTTSTLSTKAVYNPASLNTEFTLQPGQSIDKTETLTVTTLVSPFPTGPLTTTSTDRHTYEARETITVQGKAYDTCRYKVTTVGEPDSTMSWILVGKGIAVRVSSTADGQTSTIELKSGTYNGSPL